LDGRQLGVENSTLMGREAGLVAWIDCPMGQSIHREGFEHGSATRGLAVTDMASGSV
jgi:hypothetical protein